jgi:SWI/SNF-related matrix-associated actin-dependent regulator 1 of chromatin subfamily A
MQKYKEIAVKIDGSVSTKNRQKAIDSFQNNPNTRVFVGNIQAAGVGTTLTASSNIVHLELGWTSTEHDQAGARVHRVSQTRKVNEYYLIATNTIEEKIARILDNKRQIVDKITDGKDTGEESLLQELMKDYEEEAFV